MSKEKVTYVTYNRGLEVKHLHLGNLVHDYKNPNALEPYVEKACADIAEPPAEWARSIALENYALTLSKGSTEDDDSEDEAVGSNSKSGASPRYQVVAAPKGVKVEIKEPKKFFNEVILTSNEAKKWISTRYSAVEFLAASQESPHPPPQLWMLTGLIIMTHATWSSISSDDHSFIAGLPAPFDPTGVSAIRKLSVSGGVRPVVGYTPNDDEGKHVSGAVIHETGKYPGTRGWAARWEKVDIQVLPAEKMTEGANNQLKLIASSAHPAKIVAVELKEGEYAVDEAEKDGTAKQLDEKYWEALLDESDEDS